MRVLFLEIEAERDWALASVGPAFLGAYVRTRGHQAALLRVPIDEPLSTTLQAVSDHRPDLLGMSLTTRQWLRAREVASSLRRELDIPMVAGGLHPTFAPEQVLAAHGVDAICLGEGEQALASLLDHLAEGGEIPEGVPNLWRDGSPRPPLGPPLQDLDAMPNIARDLLAEAPGVSYLTTQRGCPFPCTYCGARQYQDLYAGIASYGRRRSVGNVLAEIDSLRASGTSWLIFLDDTFTINHPWLVELCGELAKRGGIPFSINARVETVSPRILDSLVEAGCRHITYGVESGSERLRREVLRRPVSNARFADVFDWTRARGIAVTANYMMGLPGETREDLEETFTLHARLDPVDFGYFVFYPYPGTELYRVCRDQGYLPNDLENLPANHRRSVLTLPDLSQDDIAAAYDRFTEIRSRGAVDRTAPAHHAEVEASVRAAAAQG